MKDKLSRENYNDGLKLAVWIVVACVLGFGAFLLFGGRTMEYNGLSIPVETEFSTMNVELNCDTEGLQMTCSSGCFKPGHDSTECVRRAL